MSDEVSGFSASTADKTDERVFCYRYFSEFFRGTFENGLADNWSVICEILRLPVTEADFGLALQQKWAKCFLGVSDDTLPLTQSAWSNAARLQCQQPCLDAHKAYEEAGVVPQYNDDYLFEDHLSLLLGFMAYQLESGRDPHAFFSRHFGQWIDLFCAQASAALDCPFASEVLEAFHTFLERERDLLM